MPTDRAAATRSAPVSRRPQFTGWVTFGNRRWAASVALFALLLGACSGPSSTPPSAPSPTANATLGVPAPTPSSETTAAAAAARPGWILLEHFGNAADGTPLPDNDTRHLWLVKADGSDLHELVPGQPDTAIDGPSATGYRGKVSSEWSPDGKHIAFEIESDNGPHIFETDVDGAPPRLVSTDCEPKLGICGDRYPAYSPDGKGLAFARQTWTPAPSGVIAIRDLATGKVTLLESTRQVPPKNEMGRPAWSPDGKQIIYYVVPKDIYGEDVSPLGPSVMYIVNADGSGLHALKTPGLVATGDASWSPDSSLIVFSTTPLHEWATHGVDPSPDVYTIHPDGTGMTRLTTGGGSGAPSWTSDGKILFTTVFYRTNAALWLMDADGSHRIRIGPGRMDLLSTTTGYTYYASWQPITQ
jgi:hypothetical protein